MDATEDPTVEVAGTTPHSSSGPDDPTVVRLRGGLGAPGADADPVAGLLAGLLREHVHVVADVSALHLDRRDPTGAVLAFPAALDRAGWWPSCSLVLAAPGGPLAAALAGSGVARRVPVHPDVATAVAHCGDRPEIVRARWTFEVDPHAPGRARSCLRRVCRDWSVGEEALEAAEIVVTELVTNAVEHAASGSVVEVARVADLLRMTVRDFDARPLPAVPAPTPDSVRGRGLAMVAAVSTTWGVQVHADGKTFWSELPV